MQLIIPSAGQLVVAGKWKKWMPGEVLIDGNISIQGKVLGFDLVSAAPSTDHPYRSIAD
jgi:hypothetical protein